jgi:hypothetical protein
MRDFLLHICKVRDAADHELRVHVKSCTIRLETERAFAVTVAGGKPVNQDMPLSSHTLPSKLLHPLLLQILRRKCVLQAYSRDGIDTETELPR